MYKYSLHSKSIKHRCPGCGKKRFVFYINNETNEYVSEKVGRCDREVNCGYHFKPKQFFENSIDNYKPYLVEATTKVKKNSFHSADDLSETLGVFEENNFIQFLKNNFKKESLDQVLKSYKVGTARYWNNGTVFWQIDRNGIIRAGKIILYDKKGKRSSYVNWVHAIKLKSNEINEYILNQCFFGEHLIKKSDKVIAIVESEKTAIVMSLMFEKYLWLATGSLNGLSEKKINVLKNRRIILYPDLGIRSKRSPFSQWKEKAISFKKQGFDIEVSDLLERKGSDSDREKGLDIADYFLNVNVVKRRKIYTKNEKVLLKMYMKNKQIKTLIDVFGLTDDKGKFLRIE